MSAHSMTLSDPRSHEAPWWDQPIPQLLRPIHPMRRVLLGSPTFALATLALLAWGIGALYGWNHVFFVFAAVPVIYLLVRIVVIVLVSLLSVVRARSLGLAIEAIGLGPVELMPRGKEQGVVVIWHDRWRLVFLGTMFGSRDARLALEQSATMHRTVAWVSASFACLGIVLVAVSRLAMPTSSVTLLLGFAAFVVVFEAFSMSGRAFRQAAQTTSGPKADDMVDALLLIGMVAERSRPRTWDPAVLERVADWPRESSMRALACHLLYWRALDSGQVEAAGRYISRSLALDTAASRPAVPLAAATLADAAAYAAWFLGRPAYARRLLAQTRNRLLDTPIRLRAEAAILRAEGDIEGARRTAEKALEILEHRRMPGIAGCEAEWLRAIASA